jgi:tetratricopeptide (TPR) repeat protein
MPQARAMAQRALDLDPSLAEAHASLGNVAMVYDRDWTRAEAQFQRSLELDPSYAPARGWYAMGLSLLGRFEEARNQVAEARLLDPLSPILAVQNAAVEYRARDNEVAGAILEQLLQREPDFAAALSLLARLSLSAGKSEEALAAADELPDSYFWVKGLVYASLGRRTEALAILEQQLERRKTDYVAPSRIAWIYLGLGEVGWTLEWLRRGQADRSLVPGSLSYPDFDPLRSDMRFQTLVRDLSPLGAIGATRTRRR